MSTRECVHLVTCSYFRSQMKDGAHASDRPQVKVLCCTHSSPLCVV